MLRSEEVANIRRTILLHKVYESVPIKLQLNEEEMALFAVHRYQFSGVDIRTRLARHYPLGKSAVHAIGYVSAINEQDMKQIDSDEYAGTSLIGKLGVEAPTSSNCTANAGPGKSWSMPRAARWTSRETTRRISIRVRRWPATI